MLAVMWVAAIVAVLVHVVIFCMESLWWGRPAIRRRFRQTEAEAETNRLFALNQGFYNLFLALGVVTGLGLAVRGQVAAGFVLAGWSCLSMLGAAVVLAVSAPRMRSAAVVQGAAPLVALVAAALS
jgi:putative membrane protein